MKYHTTALSTFHQINAFEEDGFLIVDMCCSDDGKALNIYYLQNLRKSGEALDEVSNAVFPVFLIAVCIPHRHVHLRGHCCNVHMLFTLLFGFLLRYTKA